MSTDELPDFQSAPAWMDCHGQIHTDIDLDPDMEPWLMHQRLAPWTPLDTAGGWVQRIDRDELAVENALTPDPSHAGMGTGHVGMDWAREIADAVLAALPELMGGEQA